MVVLAGSIKFSFCLCFNQASSDAEDSMVAGEAGSNYASPHPHYCQLEKMKLFFLSYGFLDTQDSVRCFALFLCFRFKFY